ncbi:hypothetical protein [Bradyrhizobium sp. USDA 10063]
MKSTAKLASTGCAVKTSLNAVLIRVNRASLIVLNSSVGDQGAPPFTCGVYYLSNRRAGREVLRTSLEKKKTRVCRQQPQNDLAAVVGLLTSTSSTGHGLCDNIEGNVGSGLSSAKMATRPWHLRRIDMATTSI